MSDYFFPPSKPRAARGGIKAQTKRGAFGQSWWAKRWITTLESFDIGARLSRGRSYARQGQVLDIAIEKGQVTANVQGSQRRPYAVAIGIDQLSEAEWERVVKVLSSQVIYSAKLLAGEMPEDIETVFDSADVSLFPESKKAITTQCSCPDWSNPCKHVAAVYYLLGEEFDRDPFLIFRLRGMERDALLEKLNYQAPAQVASLIEEEPLPAAHSEFWREVVLPPDFLGEVHAPPLNAAVPKRLGNFPFWRGHENFLDTMGEIYAACREGIALERSEKLSA